MQIYTTFCNYPTGIYCDFVAIATVTTQSSCNDYAMSPFTISSTDAVNKL